MIKKEKNFKNLITLIILTLILTLPISVYGWTAIEKNIFVRFAQIQLWVNGEKIITEAEPFIYNGNVYAPVATIANALDVKWVWDNLTPSVEFIDREEQIKRAVYDNLEFAPLGNNYYWYYDKVGVSIWKGLRHQDKESTEVPFPLVEKEDTITQNVDLEIKEFVDIDQDGKKQELLMINYLHPMNSEQEKFERYIHVIKLKDQERFETLGFIQVESFARIHFDDKSHQIFVKHYPPETEKLMSIKIYEWQNNKIEKIDELSS